MERDLQVNPSDLNEVDTALRVAARIRGQPSTLQISSSNLFATPRGSSLSSSLAVAIPAAEPYGSATLASSQTFQALGSGRTSPRASGGGGGGVLTPRGTFSLGAPPLSPSEFLSCRSPGGGSLALLPTKSSSTTTPRNGAVAVTRDALAQELLQQQQRGESPQQFQEISEARRAFELSRKQRLFPLLPLSETVFSVGASSQLTTQRGADVDDEMRTPAVGKTCSEERCDSSVHSHTMSLLLGLAEGASSSTKRSRRSTPATQARNRQAPSPSTQAKVGPTGNPATIDPDVEQCPPGGSPSLKRNTIPSTFLYGGFGGHSISESVDHDNDLIRKIVERFALLYAKEHKAQPLRTASTTVLDGTSSSSDESVGKIFMQSVLSVSKSYELAVGKVHGTQGATDQSRRSRHARLAAPFETKIPTKYWVARDVVVTDSLPQQQSDGSLFLSIKNGSKVLAFPSSAPNNRPEVYLLAHALDRMAVDTVEEPKVLFDASYAFGILPRDLSRDSEQSSTAVLVQYTNAVNAFWGVMDAGLSEISRQISSHCIERASLLDTIREMSTSVCSTLIDVVAHCKRVAYEEAKRRQEYDDILTSKNRQIIDSRMKIASLEDRVLVLEKEVEINGLKAQRFDAILSRMDVTEQQRERAILRMDQLELLDEVDEIVSKAAMNATNMMDADAQQGGQVGEGGQPIESTLAKLQREKREEDEKGNAKLYEESIKLMRTLREAVDATDSACEPFYNRLMFGNPELNVRISTGRWKQLAEAIGEQEVLLDHRERIAKAHSLWLEGIAAKATAALADDGMNSDSRLRICDYQCTVEHLKAMGVTDVTPDEVNLFQRADFDVEQFVHPSLRLPPKWGISNGGVAQMLDDVSTTFREIVLRLRALTTSGLLNEISKPPLMPPQRPSDSCSLCGRKDAAEIEKRHQRAVIDNVVKEMMRREEDALVIIQATQKERDMWRYQYDAQVDQARKLEDRLELLENRPTMDDIPTLPKPPAALSPTAADRDGHGEGGGANIDRGSSSSRCSSRRDSNAMEHSLTSAPRRLAGSRRSSQASLQSPTSRNSPHQGNESPAPSASVASPPGKGKKAGNPLESAVSRVKSSLASLKVAGTLVKKKSTLASKKDLHASPSPVKHLELPPVASPTGSGSYIKRGSGLPVPSPTSSRKGTAKPSSLSESQLQEGRVSPDVKGTSSEGPLVIQLVINCKCCQAGGGDGGQDMVPSTSGVMTSMFQPINLSTAAVENVPGPMGLSLTAAPPALKNTGSIRRSLHKPLTADGEPGQDHTHRKATLAPADGSGTPPATTHSCSSGNFESVVSLEGAQLTVSMSMPAGENRLDGNDEGSESREPTGDTDVIQVPSLGSFLVSVKPNDPIPPLDPTKSSAKLTTSTSIAALASVEGEGPQDGEQAATEDPAMAKSAAMWGVFGDNIMYKLKALSVEKALGAPVRQSSSSSLRQPTVPTTPAARKSSAKSLPGESNPLHRLSKPRLGSARSEDKEEAELQTKIMKRSLMVVQSILMTTSTAGVDEEKVIESNLANAIQQNEVVLARIEEKMGGSSDPRPILRPVGWLLTLIGNYYKAKRLADATAEHDKTPLIEPMKFLFVFLKRQLGSSDIVHETIRSVLQTCKHQQERDVRVKQFLRVLFLYDMRTVSFFLQLSLFIEQCSHGLDYSATHTSFAADDTVGKPEVACLRRIASCLAQSGLYQRPYANALWKMMCHQSVAFQMSDFTFFPSLKKAGFVAESIQRCCPKDWSREDISLQRFVVHKSLFLCFACQFERKHHEMARDEERTQQEPFAILPPPAATSLPALRKQLSIAA